MWFLDPPRALIATAPKQTLVHVASRGQCCTRRFSLASYSVSQGPPRAKGMKNEACFSCVFLFRIGQRHTAQTGDFLL